MIKMNTLRLASLALAGLGAVASGNAFAASMTVDSNGGIEVFELGANKDYWFALGGRLHLDTAWYDGKAVNRSRFPSGSRIREARIALKGGVGNNWVYKLDIDFIDDATRTTSNYGGSTFGEAFIAYNGCERFWVALGQVSVPYSLEGWGSNDVKPFMELALPVQAFAPNYGIGAYVEWHHNMFTAAGTIYHPKAGTRQTGDVLSNAVGTAGAGVNGSDPGSDTLGAGGRVTFSPVHNSSTVYHAGVSYRYENLHQWANSQQYIAGAEIASRQAPVLFTNIPPNSVKNHSVFGAELAARFNQFMVAGEYLHAHASRNGVYYPTNGAKNPGGTLRYNGYYFMASYVLTGESKEYDFASGTFGRVIPKSKKGAWEILARHSYVRLLDNTQLAQLPIPWNTPNNFSTAAANADAGINANNMPGVINGIDINDMVGNANSTTIGLTYWRNENVRFMFNYARMQYPNLKINAFGLRGQVNF